MWDSEAAQNNLVAEVNRLYQVGGLETALKIGHYLIQTVFGGDGQRTLDTKRHPNSFLALSKRKDLTVQRTFLYYSVVVTEQFGLFPVEIGLALTLRHHKELLVLKDVARKRELAHLAATQRWSYRRLRDEVQMHIATKIRPTVSRPSRPPFVRGADLVRKGAELIFEPRDDAADIAAYGCAAANEALRQVRSAAFALQTRCDALESVMYAICAAALGVDAGD